MAAIDIVKFLETTNICTVPLQSLKVLDFGCGNGDLVAKLRERGIDAHGVDITILWPSERIGACQELLPDYRIPFDDNEFDLVISTSVMEHVQNKMEAFIEIRRVLKFGSYAAHVFPSKFFLPLEPHIKVPLVSWLYPNVPKIYLSIFAILGFRNIHQKGLSWREVRDLNDEYILKGLNYWPRSKYLEILNPIYTHSRFDDDYACSGNGTVAIIDRKLKLHVIQKVWRFLSALFRTQLLVCKK
jgi:SAM-dependent methyltransferase